MKEEMNEAFNTTLLAMSLEEDSSALLRREELRTILNDELQLKAVKTIYDIIYLILKEELPVRRFQLLDMFNGLHTEYPTICTTLIDMMLQEYGTAINFPKDYPIASKENSKQFRAPSNHFKVPKFPEEELPKGAANFLKSEQEHKQPRPIQGADYQTPFGKTDIEGYPLI